MWSTAARCSAVRTAPRRGLATLTSSELEKDFAAMLPEAALQRDPSTVEGHRMDWLKQFEGPVLDNDRTPKFVLRPGSTEEVSEILKYCHKHEVPVVPQGGNTGLVGGSVPKRGDEVVLNLARMNKVLDFDDVGGVISCQAGCILADLESYASARGYLMPLDLGASGSCQIGGNLATNAGGIRLVRYGSLRSNVLGLEAVLADGTVLDMMNTLRKDNTGYDLKQLLVGSEGTLGVITGAAIITPPKPVARQVALLALDSFDEVLSTLQKARSCLGEVLSAAEFWDSPSLNMLLDTMPEVVSSRPIEGDHPFYLLIEAAGSDAEHDMAKLERFLDGFEHGVLAMDESQVASLWSIRENLPVALQHRGGRTYKYDVSIPSSLFDELTNLIRKRVASVSEDAFVMQYGHIGDGNVHVNGWSPAFDQDVLDALEDELYAFLTKHRGSISAEHGIGVLKAKKMHISNTESSLALMRSIKNLLDPKNILNPGKVLPEQA
ncbi:D-2-hydroxyglutarate dehydrogenase, mitochondrial [Hondaea fermentalgiana]|uniref:D-2-hydroxyglutarate dehydrogenase, mitochondrial n=1 Tax=Hondaea fermentalgiana TaxID=2315210 RepID=A0A2R5GMJ8_9STRA|nr:D-2-hydroxyglutarate dehydrogenase, mitochondrial [Hondaea fermentalgiana]|eukprot:GBG31529.1 D-2-hydroxyglutarate dehydrogenase, mitochondrial [Hondaea fermentalgiana]